MLQIGEPVLHIGRTSVSEVLPFSCHKNNDTKLEEVLRSLQKVRYILFSEIPLKPHIFLIIDRKFYYG